MSARSIGIAALGVSLAVTSAPAQARQAGKAAGAPKATGASKSATTAPSLDGRLRHACDLNAPDPWTDVANSPRLQAIDRRVRAAGFELPSDPRPKSMNPCASSGFPEVAEVARIVAAWSDAVHRGATARADSLRALALARIEVHAGKFASPASPDTADTPAAAPGVFSFASYTPSQRRRVVARGRDVDQWEAPKEVLAQLELASERIRLRDLEGAQAIMDRAHADFWRWAQREERGLLKQITSEDGSIDRRAIGRILRIEITDARIQSLTTEGTYCGIHYCNDDFNRLLDAMGGQLDKAYLAWYRRVPCPATHAHVVEALQRDREISLFRTTESGLNSPLVQDIVESWATEDTDESSRATRAAAAKIILDRDDLAQDIRSGDVQSTCPWQGTIVVRDSSASDTTSPPDRDRVSTVHSHTLRTLTLTLTKDPRPTVRATLQGEDELRTHSTGMAFCSPGEWNQRILSVATGTGLIRDFKAPLTPRSPTVGGRSGEFEDEVFVRFTGPKATLTTSVTEGPYRSDRFAGPPGNQHCEPVNGPAETTTSDPSPLAPMTYALRGKLQRWVDPRSRRVEFRIRGTDTQTLGVGSDVVHRTITWDIDRSRRSR